MPERFKTFGLSSEAPAERIERERDLIRNKIFAYVELSLTDPKQFVGSGSIAKVVSLKIPGEQRVLCAKFIDTARSGGTIQYPERGNKTPHYNNFEREAELLDALRDIDRVVRVPKPYYFWEAQEQAREEAISRGTKSFLVMEELDAVSFTDIFEYGRATLPDAFNPDIFFPKLREFFAKAHERHIFHRDVHGGNIMVDRETGNPRVIDLGSGAFSTEAEAYQGEWRGATVRFPNDDAATDRLEREVRKELTNESRYASLI